MSTPARNTRLQSSGKLNKHSNSDSDSSIKGNNNDNKDNPTFVKPSNTKKSLRSVTSVDRSLKKRSIYRSIDNKKDALVQRWLATSQELEINSNKIGESVNWNWEEATSQTSSEVSFNLPKRSINIGEMPEPNTLQASVTEDAEIQNMRESERPGNKMKKMAKKLAHGSLNFNHDNVVNEVFIRTQSCASLRDSQAELPVTESTSRSMQSLNYDGSAEIRHGNNQPDQIQTENPENDESKGGNHDTQSPEMQKNDVEVLTQFKTRLEADDKTVVYDMFELMITKMSCIETSLNKVKNVQGSLTKKITALENAMGSYERDINEMEEDVAEVSDMNIKLVQAAIKCDENFRTVASKVKNVTRAMNKGCYICYGLANKKNDVAKETIKKFCSGTLGLKDQEEINITTAYMIGKKDHSPIVFQLQDPNDAQKIFAKITDKKPKNVKDRRIIIREFLDAEDRDEKKKTPRDH